MRWQSTQRNAERTRTAFLWLPRCAWRQRYRWLERATWLERFNGHSWQTVEWIDDEPIPYTITEAGKELIARGIPKAKA